MPTSMTVLSPAKDDESDENISLDLHVSDAEDTEDIIKDKNDEEIPMEIEDDILNKFEIKETLRPEDIPSNDDDDDEVLKENGEEDKENGEEEEVLVEVKKATEDEEVKDTVKEKKEDKQKVELMEEEKKEDKRKVELMEEEKEEVMVEVKEEDIVVEDVKVQMMEESTEKMMGDVKEEKIDNEKMNDKKVKAVGGEKTSGDQVQKGENKMTEEEAKPDEDSNKETEGEQEDLLQIMEEKSTEADETEFENENEAEEESTKGDEKNGTSEHSENNSDDNPSDSEGGHSLENQEKDPSNAVSEETDENVDSTMDIEEESVNNDDANHLEDETSKEHDASQDGLNVTVIENKVSEHENETEPSGGAAKTDENKENVENNKSGDADEGKSVLESILKSAKPFDSKSTKRQLSDDESAAEDSSKKIKLVEEAKEAPKLQDTTVVHLNSFKKFMLDKSLKGITRDQLEIFCIQKMCECIVQKSEIGELKLKVKMQETLLDGLRKEVVNVSKQARDLNIVHQKVIQDVGRLQDSSDKPLIVPKITRSVGLQAVIRSDDKRKPTRPSPVVSKTPSRTKNTPVANITPVPQRTTPTNDRVAPKTKNTQSTPTTRGSTTTKPKTVVTPTASAPPTNAATPAKTPEVIGKGAGVIDLTDEDDKKAPAATTPVPNGTKVNMINAPNGHKFVLMPNGQTVMVKIATPSSTGTVVSQPVIRTVQASPTNGVVRTINSNSVLRPMQQPVRAVLTTQVRGRAPVPTIRPQRPMFRAQVQKVVRHPAPLPNASPVFIEGAKPIPPKPHLMLNKTSCGTGIVLSWKMPYKLDIYEKIASYQLYAYQETKSEPKTENWGKIGDVKALELPMAVTLTHFAVGNRYYFAVRAVDNQSRPGEFSEYQTILL